VPRLQALLGELPVHPARTLAPASVEVRLHQVERDGGRIEGLAAANDDRCVVVRVADEHREVVDLGAVGQKELGRVQNLLVQVHQLLDLR